MGLDIAILRPPPGKHQGVSGVDGFDCNFSFFFQWAPVSPVNLPVNGGITIRTRQTRRSTRSLEAQNRGIALVGMSPPELASQMISRTRTTGRIAYASKGLISTQRTVHGVSCAQPDTTAQTATRRSAPTISTNPTLARPHAYCVPPCQADLGCITTANQTSSSRCAWRVSLIPKTNP